MKNGSKSVEGNKVLGNGGFIVEREGNVSDGWNEKN